MEIKRFGKFILENQNLERPESFDLVKDLYKESILILRDKKTQNPWAFYYDDISNKDFGEYEEVDKIFYGYDEDDEAEWEYDWENYDPSEEAKLQYVNENVGKLSIGKGLQDWENGIELVQINQSLAHEFLSNYHELSPRILGLV
jgi:hypothetical protein